MAWNLAQKALVHIYKQAAALADQDYRQILLDVGNCASAAHPALTNFHFDQAMARIEAVLAYRVAEAIVPMPSNRKIQRLDYWRQKCPAPGMANSRQLHEIHDWWFKLQPFLEPEKRNSKYLNSIAAHAAGLKWLNNLNGLRAHQAGLVIEALKDRLRHSFKSAGDVEAHIAGEEGRQIEPEVMTSESDPDYADGENHNSEAGVEMQPELEAAPF